MFETFKLDISSVPVTLRKVDNTAVELQCESGAPDVMLLQMSGVIVFDFGEFIYSTGTGIPMETHLNEIEKVYYQSLIDNADVPYSEAKKAVAAIVRLT